MSLSDDFRSGLVRACQDWMAGEVNQTRLSIGATADLLLRMTEGGAPLFDAAQDAPPVSFAPPEIEVDLVQVGDAGLASKGEDAFVFQGRIGVEITASGVAGLAQLEVRVAPVSAWEGATASTPDTPTERLAVTGQIDGDALANDTLVSLRITATDALGQSARRTVRLRVDNEAPQLALVRPASFQRRPYQHAWLTRFLVHEVTVELSEPALVVATIGGAAQRVTPTGERQVEVAVELPGAGVHDLKLTATDALGNRAEWVQALRVDDIEPTIQWVDTNYRSESGVDCRRSGLGEIEPARFGTGAEVYKWATALEQDDQNPLMLRWSASDDLAAPVEVRWSLQRDWQDVMGPVRQAVYDPSEELFGANLTAADLPFDPLTLREADIRVRADVVDAAGNTSPHEMSFTLILLAPPPCVEIVEGDLTRGKRRFVRGEEVPPSPFLGQPSALDDLYSRTGVDVIRYRLTNPHEVPIRVSMFPVVMLDTTIQIEGVVETTEIPDNWVLDIEDTCFTNADDTPRPEQMVSIDDENTYQINLSLFVVYPRTCEPVPGVFNPQRIETSVQMAADMSEKVIGVGETAEFSLRTTERAFRPDHPVLDPPLLYNVFAGPYASPRGAQDGYYLLFHEDELVRGVHALRLTRLEAVFEHPQLNATVDCGPGCQGPRGSFSLGPRAELLAENPGLGEPEWR